jgi:hypothetical protein
MTHQSSDVWYSNGVMLKLPTDSIDLFAFMNSKFYLPTWGSYFFTNKLIFIGLVFFQTHWLFAGENIDAIGLQVSEQNLTQFGIDLPTHPLEQQISKNLSEWQFPIQAAGLTGAKYILEVEVGELKHDKTPVGFSFSSGNSDPRALEFQKSEVLEINCRLSKKPAGTLIKQTSLSFSANSLIEAKQHPSATVIANELANHISTTCYELLTELHFAQPAPAQLHTTRVPSWMPSVRIETQETLNEPTGKKLTQPQEQTDSAVNVERESTKQITIHNLGSPLILKLGHDRL